MSLSGRIGTSTAKIYKYDAFNRLVQFNEGATEATYTYSADNLRNSKTVNGTRIDFVWNGQNLASETKNDITTAYTYDPTGIVMSNNGTDTVRFIKDPHGNVVATSKNDKIVDSYDYTAFGVQLNSAETSNPFRYCGEYYDEELDSIYLRNRYYQPTTGRFINEDPIKDGLNWYAYANNNPVMFIDSSGLKPGDSFNTLNEAAEDAGNYYLAQTFMNNEEVCGILIKNSDGTYTYQDVANNATDKTIEFSITWSGSIEAYIHTHVFYNVNNFNDVFSNPTNTAVPGSGGDTGGSDNCNIPVYLATPYGNLRKYMPHSGNLQGDLISSDLIIDPKYYVYEGLNILVGNQENSKINQEYDMEFILKQLKKVDMSLMKKLLE